MNLIRAPSCFFQTACVTIARGAARVNVVSHTRTRWARHRRVGHASRAPAVVARVARISPEWIIGGGTEAPEVFAVRPGRPRPSPTDAGRVLGRTRPALPPPRMPARFFQSRFVLRLLA